MAYLNSNSFYSSFAKKKGLFSGGYQAPTSSAFGGSLSGPTGTVKPSSTVTGSPLNASKPASSSSVPTASAAHATPPVAPQLPPDPAYDLQLGALGKTRDDTLAALAQQRLAGLTSYGYTEDPVTHALSIDPNNPYSQNALLTKSYKLAQGNNTVAYAERGLGYSGALQSAQETSADQYGQSQNALKTAVQNFLARNTQDTNAAASNYDYNAALALSDSLGRAATSPLGGAVPPPAVDPATVQFAPGMSLAPGWELYRDPVTGDLKARKVGS